MEHKISISKLIILIVLNLFAMHTTEAAKPKLIVGIVVDQMRVDYLSRYESKFSEGGFKKLISGGYFNKNTNFNYVPTYTGPGHASIFTGSTPRINGIIANDWYDKKTGKEMYCTDDKTVNTVGSSSKAGMMSPRNMLTTTIGDEMRLASNMKAKVIGISQKDRASILPAGHTANAAYWYDGSNGAFISSTFYMQQLPTWVSAFNEKKLPEKYLSQDWTTLLPMSAYTESMSDDNAFEGTFKGESKPVFPHKLAELKDKNKGLNMLRATPFGNTLTKEFAIEAIKNEQLGADEVTDFLSVSFSSTDYVGHQFGTNAIETQDTYLRLDKDLEEFIAFLEKQIGRDNFIIFLTADHGGAHNAAYLQSVKIPAGYIDEKMISDSMKAHLMSVYGDSLVRSYSNQQFFFNHDAMAKKKLKLKEVSMEAVRYSLTLEGVANAYTLFDIMAASQSADFALSRIYMGYNDVRSGDVVLNYLPAYLDYQKTGTTHGAAYTYDTHVPLIWYGWKISAGASYEPVNISDIAPTISSFLDIAFPNGCVGQPIKGLIK